MKNFTVAFIGSGNIARSIIGGLIANGMDAQQLIAADPDKAQQQLIAEKYGIRVLDVNCEAAKKTDIKMKDIDDYKNLLNSNLL